MNQIVSVFTPVYNRKKLLFRLYESLTKQTNYNFEWIIFDDCSVDGSYELAKELEQRENRFQIKVDRAEHNGGKHRAINRGAAIANGFLFFIVDSDDALTPDAIEKIFAWEKTIQETDSFAGLGFLRSDPSMNPLGTTFPGHVLDCTTLEREMNGIQGDKAEVFYTQVIRKYPFPEIEGEKFLTEAVVWERIAYDGLKIRWINEIIYLCEYQSDGLSANYEINLANNPKGYALYLKQRMGFVPCFGYEGYLCVYGYYYTVNLAKRYSMRFACEQLGYPLLKAYFYMPIRKVNRICSRIRALFSGGNV